MRYPIVIHKDTDSDYGVIVPDLPGCFSAGTTLDEAMSMAQDAIECHIGGLLLDGEQLPLLHSIENHQAKVLDFVEFLKIKQRHGEDETAYLLREPANARDLLAAARELHEKKGYQARELLPDD
ncbi:MAG: type II toxin-antitoxin system HicB family antitoxin [Proteobacteria bacterium]|nr:type II toxin-antitoxin system HicB family antitoxin [Pseudomonadota bacterium]